MRLAELLEKRLGLEGLSAPENRAVVRWGFGLAVLAMVLRVVFWVVTQRYWEDALITCLHAENFAQGFGLTHVRPGEPPLHGFTSPLSVLVPLLGDLMHVGFGVDFIKLVSIPAAALTVIYVLAIAVHPSVRLAGPLAVLAMGYVAIEHQQILWGMAGMETQLATLILLMSIYYAIAWRPAALGLSLGLCMLARPDYAFWTAIAGVYGLFRSPRDLPKVVGIALAVYLPWIAFCFWEYGSPLPNTIVAKGLGYPQWWEKADTIDFFTIKRHTWMMMAEQIHLLLGPTFAGHGAGLHIFFSNTPESPIANFMFAFAVLGTLAIVLGRKWTLWPLAACVVAYSLYYVYLVPVVFGWYKVPYIATLLLLSVWGLHTAARLIPGATFRNGLLAAFAAAYLGVFAAVLPVTFWTERQIQQYVENDVRKPAGLWLREHMKEDEAVGCEPLGYISYYSRGNVYDWPGLASRTVVAWSKEHPEDRNLEGMLKGLQPEYLFLRDMEILFWFQDPEWFREHYHVEAVFQVDPEKAKEIRWLDRNIDTRFRIYKKNHEGDAPYDDSLWPTVESFAGRAMGKPATGTP
ncbi:MAG: hypothetical protein GC168_21465 [Candidatus Hydrogenedens sp.]|nr:hypothetical protein [Candidatus Hydrogenedens sp.]